MIASKERLVRFGMLHTKPFHWCLVSHWNVHWDPSDVMMDPRNHKTGQLVVVSEQELLRISGLSMSMCLDLHSGFH